MLICYRVVACMRVVAWQPAETPSKCCIGIVVEFRNSHTEAHANRLSADRPDSRVAGGLRIAEKARVARPKEAKSQKAKQKRLI